VHLPGLELVLHDSGTTCGFGLQILKGDVGYRSGDMTIPAMALLAGVPEEEAFWMVVQVLSKLINCFICVTRCTAPPYAAHDDHHASAHIGVQRLVNIYTSLLRKALFLACS
jgi:hypothetical protein